MNKTYDIQTQTLIIGGGPSGSTLARKLAKNNVEVILVEKNSDYDKPCGGGIKSIVFGEFDIPKIYENKLIKDFTLYSPNKKVHVDLSKTPISIVLRQEFDKANRELARKDGATLIEGRYKKSLKIDDSYIVEINTKEKILKIKTKYLVGADGVKSSVRKDVFDSYPNSILTHYCNIPTKSIDRCEFYFGKDFAPKEYAWVFPHGDKLSVGSVLKEDSNAKNLFFNFKNSIVENDDTKTKGFYIPVWEQNDIFNKENVFLVGDAAGQVLPFTYEGIYYAMKSADILADAIIKDSPYLYEKEWKKKFDKRFKFFKRMQKIFLSCDFMTDKMISSFQNEKLQKRALKYWEGTVPPLSFGQTVLKIIKYLIKY